MPPSLERRDVEPKRHDIAPVLGQKPSHLYPTLIHPRLNPTAPPLSPPPTSLLPSPLPALAHPHQPSATVPSLHHNFGCPNPCPCRPPLSSASLWLGPVWSPLLGLVRACGPIRCSRGRGSFPASLLACVPIVHPRCSIFCPGHLGVAFSMPYGPSVPLGA